VKSGKKENEKLQYGIFPRLQAFLLVASLIVRSRARSYGKWRHRGTDTNSAGAEDKLGSQTESSRVGVEEDGG